LIGKRSAIQWIAAEIDEPRGDGDIHARYCQQVRQSGVPHGVVDLVGYRAAFADQQR